MTRIVITVMPKDGVLDPQGQAVAGALGRLGYGQVGDVRVGKRIELDVGGPDPAATATEMCRDLLANDLIEDFTVEVAG